MDKVDLKLIIIKGNDLNRFLFFVFLCRSNCGSFGKSGGAVTAVVSVKAVKWVKSSINSI